MSDTFSNFMIYDLDDSGDYNRLNITEEEFRENNGRNILHDEQVVVVIKEDIRRIYIWKGAKASVRKRFISSRVAGQLQEELVKDAAFHRCKIVSVDQGDEVEEFLKAFNFESMEITEKLADMHYVRNVDRDKMYDRGEIIDDSSKFVKVENVQAEHVSPALKEIDKTPTQKKQPAKTKSSTKIKIEPKRKEPEPIPQQAYVQPPKTTSLPSQPSKELSEEKNSKIKEKILKTQLPDGFKRQNLILGNTLYGAVNKTVNVLGKKIQETDWEIVTNVPKGTIEIDRHKIRVYFDDVNGIVEAVEILELIDHENEMDSKSSPVKNNIEEKEPDVKKSKSTTQKKSVPENVTETKSKEKTEADFNAMPVKDLRKYAEDHKLEIHQNARKSELIKLIVDSLDKVAPNSKKRKLPDIPKG